MTVDLTDDVQRAVQICLLYRQAVYRHTEPKQQTAANKD